MLRYKVTREDGKTVIEACSVQEFFSPNSPAPPVAQIIGIFDPDDPDCPFNDDYEYTYPDEGEAQYLDIEYNSIMVPNNKGGFDEVLRIHPMPELLLNNSSISITPADSNKPKKVPKINDYKADALHQKVQVSPVSVVPVCLEQSCDKDEKATNYKEECPGAGPSGVKRFSTSRNFNVPRKVPKICVCKPDALHQKVLEEKEEFKKKEIKINCIQPSKINRSLEAKDSNNIFHEVCRLQPMQQFLLDNPSISKTSAHPNKLPQESTNLQSMEDLNLSVDSKSNDNKTMVHNASMHQCLSIQMEDEFDKNLFRPKNVISSKLRNRISSAVLQIIEEEKKEKCAAKSEIASLQPVSPSKINRSLEAKDSKLNSANSNNIKKLVLPPDIENQINSLVSSIIEKFFATTKQPGNNQVGTQQATTSKQSVVSQSNPNR